jgi:EAL domain-containing protein (putative c-di-GMP-specific phosphodiesterase class I)
VVRAAVSLAEGFELDTVGEGVEDAQCAKLLREYGVDHLQGYYFGKPGPIGEFIGPPVPVGDSDE